MKGQPGLRPVRILTFEDEPMVPLLDENGVQQMFHGIPLVAAARVALVVSTRRERAWLALWAAARDVQVLLPMEKTAGMRFDRVFVTLEAAAAVAGSTDEKGHAVTDVGQWFAELRTTLRPGGALVVVGSLKEMGYGNVPAD